MRELDGALCSLTFHQQRCSMDNFRKTLKVSNLLVSWVSSFAFRIEALGMRELFFSGHRRGAPKGAPAPVTYSIWGRHFINGHEVQKQQAIPPPSPVPRPPSPSSCPKLSPILAGDHHAEVAQPQWAGAPTQPFLTASFPPNLHFACCPRFSFLSEELA